MSTLINLIDYKTGEEFWDHEFAKERFSRYFDECLNETDVGDAVREISDLSDKDIKVFMRTTEYRDLSKMRERLDRICKSYKLYSFFGEEHGTASLSHWQIIHNIYVASMLDGVFVASQWHKYLLLQLGYPDNKIHVSGHPINLSRFPKSEKEAATVLVTNLTYNKSYKELDFVLDVIESSQTDTTFYLAPVAREGTMEYNLRMNRQTRLNLEGKNVKTQQPRDYKYSVVWSPMICNSFNTDVAEFVLRGSHPVVPNAGCYLEMLQTHLSKNRYVYKPFDIKDCLGALNNGLMTMSPPIKYIEDYGNSFDRMAEVMLS